MDLQTQIITLVREVAELKAQVSIMWKVFSGMCFIFAAQILTEFWKLLRKKPPC